MCGASTISLGILLRVSDHPQGKEKFPNAQSDPSLVLLFAIPILPMVPRSRAWHLPFLPSQELQRAVRSTLGLLFSRVDTLASLTQHFQPCYHFCCPPLDAFNDLNITFILWRKGQHAVYVRLHQCKK